MLNVLSKRLKVFPTPVAGLALGIASIGIIVDLVLHLDGLLQTATALIAGLLLLVLAIRFILYPKTLLADLQHPVVGSVAPTFAMATMLTSNAIILHHHEFIGHMLWLLALVIHIVFLITFIYHRQGDFNLAHMVPSWFVPPVGIIVAALSYHGPDTGVLYYLALGSLYFGLICFAIMLPLMFYRFIFKDNIAHAAQPTIAVLAAPASLSMAGYLQFIKEPSMLVVLLLFGVAVLMTVIVYIAFTKLLFLPFSPGYSAFTFPMAIGATALYKVANQLTNWGVDASLVNEVIMLAHIELVLASLVILYVSIRFVQFFIRPAQA